MLCKECNERIVRMSKVDGMCELCYQVLDLDRYIERKPLKPKAEFNCERCCDTGRVLERVADDSPYMVVVKCPQCK